MHHHPHRILLSLMLLFLLQGLSHGQTINWGSTASTSSAGNKHLLSDGSTMNGGFTFQIGYFNSGFVADSPLTWEPNWRVYNDSTSGGVEGEALFNLLSGFFGYNFSGSTTITDNSFQGHQGYIFGYNSLASIGTSGGESLLVTDSSWLFPTVGDNVALDWTIDTASTVVWGAIDQNVAQLGSEIIGGGSRSFLAPEDSYHLQTASFATVPEPGSALLLLTAAMLLVRRPARGRHSSRPQL
ncbi:MAG: PEP-CTERM sorting domain-containing protein [Prosthecobacter sp.]|uniref:PEP-CTERM sorting domain-containing protein n=1 Tax=Prosthecobacter sp. TaxID=1965333 RepID=UPI0038FF675B